MEIAIGENTVAFVEHGAGPALVVLHGAGVDHRETEGAIEALGLARGLRRVYLDLPGMGRSTAVGLDGNDAVVALLCEFLDRLDAGPVALLGHSYGAYLARGIVARRPDAVRGLALACAVGDGSAETPAHAAVLQEADAYADLEPDQHAGFDEYFVVRTTDTALRYRERVVPGIGLVDQESLERIFSHWTIRIDPTEFAAPTLIVAARSDAIAGTAHSIGLLDGYPHATLALVADAGHAVLHERPELIAPLLNDWLSRVRPAG